MATKTRGLRISKELDLEIRREAQARGASWSAISNELLREAVEMRRAPGIVFADGPAGRRAVVAGSGIDVWEVIATSRTVAGEAELAASYPQLSEHQLRAALGYYQLFPEAIDRRLEREAEWTPERLRKELPFARPPSTAKG